MTDQIVCVDNDKVTDALTGLSARCPEAVMIGLRAGAGFLAHNTRALMVQRVRGAAAVSSTGRFVGKRLVDAVRVYNTPRSLMVKAYLDLRSDMRSHWLNAGTKLRYTGRRRRRKGAAGASRGQVSARRFFTDAISRRSELQTIMNRATMDALSVLP